MLGEIERIAFFGMGNMGLPIALNLLRAGYSVSSTVHNSAKWVSEFQEAGGQVCELNIAAAADVDAVFVIVSDDQALESLLLEPLLVEAIRPGTVIVDMTSASAESIRKIERRYAAKGARVIDAPVMGGPDMAAAGKLTMIVGAEDADYEQALPILKVISAKQFHVGKPGDGKIIKSINNIMAAANVLVVGEAIRMIKANNIDPDIFYNVVSNGSGNSFQLQKGFACAIAQDFTPTFALWLMEKDIRLAMQLANGIDLPVFELTKKIFNNGLEEYGDMDYFAATKVTLKP